MDQEERNKRLESAVREAVTTQAERQRADEAAARHPGKRRQGVLVVLLLVSWAAIGWIWLEKPAFIFGPDTAEVSAARQEASLRFGMVLEQTRAREFQERTGRWPTSLIELGDDIEPGVTGQPVGSGFVVTGTAGDLHFELTDQMDADSFLGQSLEVLRSNR